MGRPALLKDATSIGVSLDKKTRDRLMQEAADPGVGASHIVRQALEVYWSQRVSKEAAK